MSCNSQSNYYRVDPCFGYGPVYGYGNGFNTATNGFRNPCCGPYCWAYPPGSWGYTGCNLAYPYPYPYQGGCGGYGYW